MTRHIIRRLLYTIPVMLVVSLLVFGILHVAPGDPAAMLGGEDARPEDVAAIRAKYGLDQPLYIQYGIWIGNALRSDLGRSIVTRRPVLQEVVTRFPYTLELAVAALVAAVVAGMSVGVISATRQYSAIDHGTMVLALLGVSTPVFWLGLMLIFAFSVELRWFPTGGVGSWRHLVLPALTLGAHSMAIIARMTRSSMLEVIRQDYIRTARAKGLVERVVVLRHGLLNALIPVVTVVGLQFGYLLGGAVITETVFSRRGLGRLLIDSINSRDFPTVQGTLMLLAGSFVLVNLLVDTLYAYLDPRIRYE
ncbi:MAG: ABC transporter permease [Armatimonadetes bacterium]|nr:ABC transporter permease [Armatimonadota bacterium]